MIRVLLTQGNREKQVSKIPGAYRRLLTLFERKERPRRNVPVKQCTSAHEVLDVGKRSRGLTFPLARAMSQAPQKSKLLDPEFSGSLESAAED